MFRWLSGLTLLGSLLSLSACVLSEASLPMPIVTPTATIKAISIFTPIPISTPEPTATAAANKQDFTATVGQILLDPQGYEGQEVSIVGYYRGWDLFQEVGTGPPVTRSDWVIKDASGAMYVFARGAGIGRLDLDPASRRHCWRVLRLVGVVRVAESGQPYIDAKSVEEPPCPLGTPSEALVVRVAVEAVDVRLLESFPVQVELVIRGTLPDDCEYQLVASEEREGQMVSVTLEGQRQADLSCTAEIQPITYTLLLGDELPLAERGFAPGGYTLTVNDYQTSFLVE